MLQTLSHSTLIPRTRPLTLGDKTNFLSVNEPNHTDSMVKVKVSQYRDAKCDSSHNDTVPGISDLTQTHLCLQSSAWNVLLYNIRTNRIPKINSSVCWVAIRGSLQATQMLRLDRPASTVDLSADQYSINPKQAAEIWRQTGQQGALSEVYRPSAAVRAARSRARFWDWPSPRFYTGLLANCRTHFHLPFRRYNVYSTQFREAQPNGLKSVPSRWRQLVPTKRPSLSSNLYNITSRTTVIYTLNRLCINSCRLQTADKYACYDHSRSSWEMRTFASSVWV
jgi:hypothetical protein